MRQGKVHVRHRGVLSEALAQSIDSVGPTPCTGTAQDYEAFRSDIAHLFERSQDRRTAEPRRYSLERQDWMLEAIRAILQTKKYGLPTQH